MLELWISKAMSDGIVLSQEILRQKWNCFADLAGILDVEMAELKYSAGVARSIKEVKWPKKLQMSRRSCFCKS